MSWRDDKRSVDMFLPEVKAILGKHLIGEATREDDAERNTDLVVLRMEAVRIACRLRKPGYFDSYGGEFTIRAVRPNGCKTELQKIIEGWGDYFFYGHIANDLSGLRAWALCDFIPFRSWFFRQLVAKKGALPGIRKDNVDGSSSFLAFRFDDMPSDFLVAQHSVEREKSLFPDL